MFSAVQAWEAALGSLQVEVSRASFLTWLKDTEGLSYDGHCLVVGVPSAFVAECLEKRLLSRIITTLHRILGKEVEVQFSLKTPALPPCPLNPRYTFDNFVVGERNRLVYTIAQEVTLHPAQSYNPLFIVAEMGLGKTHILQAMGHLATAKRLSWAYLQAEQFTNDFIFSIRENRAQEFFHRFVGLKLLLVDDLHFLEGKKQTQQGFLSTVNQLYESKTQIVVSANRPPEAIALSPELFSRFQGGLLTRLHPLDKEASLSLLQALAREQGAQPPFEVLELVAQKGQGNARMLEGYLNRVISLAHLRGGTLNQELAQEALLAEEERSPTQIINLVSHYFHLPSQTLQSKRRDAKTSQARQVAIFLLRTELGMSLADIALTLGLAKSSVLYALEKIQQSSFLEKPLAEIQALLSGK